MTKHTKITAASLALFVVLAIAHTWPLATAPGTLSRNDNDDTKLHEWTLAWVAHQIVREPLHLSDANIFYPERDTLAYSDHLFPQAMMAAPLLWRAARPCLPTICSSSPAWPSPVGRRASSSNGGREAGWPAS